MLLGASKAGRQATAQPSPRKVTDRPLLCMWFFWTLSLPATLVSLDQVKTIVALQNCLFGWRISWVVQVSSKQHSHLGGLITSNMPDMNKRSNPVQQEKPPGKPKNTILLWVAQSQWRETGLKMHLFPHDVLPSGKADPTEQHLEGAFGLLKTDLQVHSLSH